MNLGAPARPSHGRPLPLILLVLTVPLLLSMFAWVADLEMDIPTLRLSTDKSASDGAGVPEVLYPGEHAVIGAPIEANGQWLQQPLGEHVWLATSEPGDSISFRFYGTESHVLARVGPESSRVYVTVDGGPVAGLTSDENGSFVDLRASRAANRTVALAEGLAHREHQITITNGEPAEFALADLVIEARNPFPWAFATIYVAIVTGLLLTVRQIAIDFARGRGWLPRHGSLLTPPVSPEATQ